MTDAQIEGIARVVHEANRAYCLTLGDATHLPWAIAPRWQCESAKAGVRAILDGRVTRPEQSHESWFAQKVADGWIYGPEKNAETKTHPCMVPFDQLPPAQQKKDALFFAIVTVLTEGR